MRVCLCAVSKRLRGVEHVGLQGPVVDVSFRHAAGVNRRDDGVG